jgi:hypothetical protein
MSSILGRSAVRTAVRSSALFARPKIANAHAASVTVGMRQFSDDGHNEDAYDPSDWTSNGMKILTLGIGLAVLGNIKSAFQ